MIRSTQKTFGIATGFTGPLGGNWDYEATLSHSQYHATIGWPQIVGASFIIAGIVCLAFSETAEAKPKETAPSSPGGNPGAGSAAASAAHLVSAELRR